MLESLALVARGNIASTMTGAGVEELTRRFNDGLA